MRNIFDPRWLFIINTFPLAILFFIFWGQFEIIKSLLNSHSITYWKIFGISLGFLGLMNFSYALYLTLKQRAVSYLYAILALFLYILFLYFYAFYSNSFIPSSVPRWMVAENILIYAGTFIMPTLAYSVLLLISHFTPPEKNHKPLMSFLLAISIPFLSYLFLQVVLPLSKNVPEKYFTHALLVTMIGITLVFLFSLGRAIFILIGNQQDFWGKYQWVWKIVFALFLPLFGLLLNNGVAFKNKFFESYAGIFGDFSNEWFYILAIINGVLICLPEFDNKKYRFSLFVGRSITFPFTIFFFLVFLPFLPISVIAIIAFGLGFLILSPLILFIIHIHQLTLDYNYLKKILSPKAIQFVFIIALLLIPFVITISYLKDKSTLNTAVEYLYTPDYSKQVEIDKGSLKKTLKVILRHKNSENFRDRVIAHNIPFLSSYFNWLVLDNLTLSNSKIAFIENVFFGDTKVKLPHAQTVKDNVVLSDFSTESTFDTSQRIWKSWVHFTLVNKNKSSRLAEYSTKIELPEGTFLSDYYLYIKDKKEMGILAEKKSAIWVYSQIRNENRDPGVLHYETGNKISFRVFPFAKNEVRKTGIEFLHKEPIEIKIEQRKIKLGDERNSIDQKIETENFHYLSKNEKEKLELVYRKPYFHFIVDTSKNKNIFINDFTQRIIVAIKKNKLLAQNAKISFVNTYTKEIYLSEDWQAKYRAQKFSGGFFLDRAIRKSLFDSYQKKQYPVFIVVTNNMDYAILEKNFADLRFAFPESNYFYYLNKNGRLRPHSLIDKPRKGMKSNSTFKFQNQAVLEYRLSNNHFAYLPNDHEPSIILKNSLIESDTIKIEKKKWLAGVSMHARYMSQFLHPEVSQKQWVQLVKDSFASKIMTPFTSYLVVENEAQKAILKKKQKQVLSGNRLLDIGNDVESMSEPSLWLILFLLVSFLFYQNKKKKAIIRK